MVILCQPGADSHEPATDPAANAIGARPSASHDRPFPPRAEIEAERFIIHEVLHVTVRSCSTERFLMSNYLW